MATDKEYTDLKSFLQECKTIRNIFVTQAGEHIKNTEFRIAAQSIVLMYDQLIAFIEKS